MPLKHSKGFLIIVAIASVGLGSVGLSLIQGRWRTYDPVQSAQLIPENAQMAVFVSPDAQAVNQLQEFGNRQTRQLLTRTLNQIKQQSLASNRLNFDRDLQPWMSGIMVALLPSTSEELDLLMVVGIKDPLRAWMFQRKFNQQPNLQQIEREYRGVTLIEYIESGGKQYHVAVLNHHVVVGANAEPIKRAIDTLLGEPALAEKTGMVQIFLNSAAVDHPLGAALIFDSQTLMEQLLSSPDSQTTGSIEILSQFQSLESAVIGVGVEPNGLRVKVVSQFDPKADFPSQNPELTPLISRFPTETVALIQGQGIDQIWSQLLNLADDNENVAQWVKQVRRGSQSINLDADQEVLGWMDGDFALGAIASDEGILAPFGLGGVLILETSDRAAAEGMLDQLDATIANSNPPVNIEQRQIADIEVTEWSDPQQGTLFGHGWLTNELLFIAFGEPVVDVMTKLPPSPLPENPQFQMITGSLPPPNISYIYLDIEQLISWATGYLLAAPAAALQPNLFTFLTSIQGVGVSVVTSEPSTTEVEMLWVLKSVTNE
jgi:hypothetical protein